MNNSSVVYDGLEPAEVWRHFAALNAIPRPSGQEAAAVDYVRQTAANHGADSITDAFGNIVLRVAGSPGRSADPLTAVQAHLDMVCQKRPEVIHDFARDPIVTHRDGDIIRAQGTTLGADNGVGAAMSLALLTTPGLVHGPLELLFTTEEETGLFGAASLGADMLRAPTLLNLDSEDPDELTVGCAGGAGVTLALPLHWAAPQAPAVIYDIAIGGLKGGHSGVQIHEPLANAIVLLQIMLQQTELCGAQLISIEGGNAHNAIPRDAQARVAINAGAAAQFLEQAATEAKQLKSRWKDSEPALEIGVTRLAETQLAVPLRALSVTDTRALLKLLSVLPHGVIAMSQVFIGKVETSSNLATITTTDRAIEIHVSSRSFVAAELELMQQQIVAIAESAGAAYELRDAYPGWEPNPASPVLDKAKLAYTDIYGHPPQVQVVHAGLECGVIIAKFPATDAISFGPLIRNAHSPDECVYASTVASSWQLLCRLI